MTEPHETAAGARAHENESDTPASFVELIRRVRAGDEQAAQTLVRNYEPAIRRAVRLRLDPRLQRVYDSMDICQAVLASFFVRAASGQYEIDTPEQLLKLLATMARHKVGKARRSQLAARRDARREVAGDAAELQVRSPGGTPSRQIAARELLEMASSRLNEDERRIVELRQLGNDWPAIATALGGSPEALRKKLTRALARVSDELGLDDLDDE
jgi:RNA polymerase sigma-70 factor (ECF subfamily)